MNKAEIIYSYCDKARRLLRRKYPRESVETLEDLVSDSVVKALDKLHTLRDERLIEYWFLSIVHNYAIGILRARRKICELKESDRVIDPRDNFDREGLEKLLVSQLSGKQLKVVWMVLIECMSLTDIAKLNGYNYNTAKANWRHGWLKIKDKVIDII